MENKRTLYSLESDIRRILEDNDFVSTCDERGKQWYINLVSDLAIYIQQELDKAREEGREELLDSIITGIEQLKSIVMMFNPISTEIRAKQSGEIEAYDGLLEKLSKLKDNK